MELFLQIAIIVAVAFIIKYIIRGISNIKNINTLFIFLKNVEWRKKKTNPKQFIEALEQKGYFKYVTQDNIDKIKLEMANDFHPKATVPMAWDEEANTSIDLRSHFCDGEDVFEQEGITNMLNDLKPHFKAFGLKIDITQHYEEWDDKKGLNHTITINNTNHIIFENYDEDGGWGLAPKRLAEILNYEFEKQGVEERVYLSMGGNEGLIHFFTDEQYKIIDANLTNKNEKPLSIDKWSKLNGLE